MRYAMITDTGNVRKKNEDRMLVCRRSFGKTEALLAAVADGMGGFSHGEQASGYVTDSLRQWWEAEIQTLSEAPELDGIGDRLSFLLEKLQAQLRRYIEEQHTNMGTTLSMVFILGGDFVVRQVGDSRIYLLDRKHCYQLTKDQTWCQQEIDAGRMSPQEAAVHKKRHVLTNALGAGPEFFIRGFRGQLHRGQRLLLCSDGYYAYLEPKELYRRFGRSLSRALAQSGERIRRGAAEDNFTAVLVEV